MQTLFWEKPVSPHGLLHVYSLLLHLMLNQYINLTQRYKKYDVYDFIFCCFLALGIVFSQERVLYLDDAYMLFNILDSANFRIEHYRYAEFIPQLFAVTGVKLGMSIKIIALLFSFGYLLFHFVIYWIVKHRLKQKALGIIYLACLLLAMHEAFFDTVSEAKLALGFGVLYAGILLSDALSNQKKLIYSIIVILLGVFSHPVFILYFGVIIFFTWMFKKHVFWQHFIIVGLILFAKSALFGTSSYESSFYEKLSDFSVFRHSFLHTYITGHLLSHYKLILIIIYMIASHLYRNNLRQELGSYIFTIAGVYFLLSIINAGGESHMMIQKTMLVLSFVCLFPMLFFYDQWKHKIFLTILIPLVLLSSFYSIDEASKKYSQRIERLSENMVSLNHIGNKLLIKEDQIEPSSMLGSWALPYESALLSKWKLDKSISIFKLGANQTINNDQSDFLHVFGPPTPTNKLNPVYFKFNPSEKYKLIDSTFRLD